jgi:hypothetical protein
METQTMQAQASDTERKVHEQRVTGIVLVSVGLVLFAGQIFDLGLWILPALAVGFIAAGIATRQAGWFIPGGILSGIALGGGLAEAKLVSGDAEGGIFLLSFALGWVSIHLLSQLFTRTAQRWALIPAGIMAIIGGAVLLGERGERLLALVFGGLNIALPLALIIGGIYLVRRRNQS